MVFFSCNQPDDHPVAQLAEALRYKAEGRGFDFRWCHWKFSLIYLLLPLLPFTIVTVVAIVTVFTSVTRVSMVIMVSFVPSY